MSYHSLRSNIHQFFCVVNICCLLMFLPNIIKVIFHFVTWNLWFHVRFVLIIRPSTWRWFRFSFQLIHSFLFLAQILFRSISHSLFNVEPKLVTEIKQRKEKCEDLWSDQDDLIDHNQSFTVTNILVENHTEEYEQNAEFKNKVHSSSSFVFINSWTLESKSDYLCANMNSDS